jgi:tRNA U34 5-methylaminomethyl-2-thiouridine-forming methyltransferase MnmC
MHKVVFQVTEDGSHTLYLPEMDEHYHSVHGAIQESNHVFIKAGLDLCPAEAPRIFEVGFGTGLNAFLSAIEAEKRDISIRYSSIELYPLPAVQATQLNYPQLLGHNDIFSRLHESQWDQWQKITPWFELKKINADMGKVVFTDDCFDLIFFDAFAPNKQADLWQPTVFAMLYKHLSPGGMLVTYCAKGVVRRMLLQAGFTVERLPGPPGKHEMLRAVK